MTKKRFRFGGNTHIIDTKTNGEYYAPCEEELLDLLNSLNDKNEQLKKEVINLKVEIDTHKHPLWSTRESERIINELKKENEQLKEAVWSWSKSYTRVYEKNEQLKKANHDLTKIVEKYNQLLKELDYD